MTFRFSYYFRFGLTFRRDFYFKFRTGFKMNCPDVQPADRQSKADHQLHPAHRQFIGTPCRCNGFVSTVHSHDQQLSQILGLQCIPAFRDQPLSQILMLVVAALDSR